MNSIGQYLNMQWAMWVYWTVNSSFTFSLHEFWIFWSIQNNSVVFCITKTNPPRHLVDWNDIFSTISNEKKIFFSYGIWYEINSETTETLEEGTIEPWLYKRLVLPIQSKHALARHAVMHHASWQQSSMDHNSDSEKINLLLETIDWYGIIGYMPWSRNSRSAIESRRENGWIPERNTVKCHV